MNKKYFICENDKIFNTYCELNNIDPESLNRLEFPQDAFGLRGDSVCIIDHQVDHVKPLGRHIHILELDQFSYAMKHYIEEALYTPVTKGYCTLQRIGMKDKVSEHCPPIKFELHKLCEDSTPKLPRTGVMEICDEDGNVLHTLKYEVKDE